MKNDHKRTQHVYFVLPGFCPLWKALFERKTRPDMAQSACLACVSPVFDPQHCLYQVQHTPYSGTSDVEAEIKAIFGYIGNSRST